MLKVVRNLKKASAILIFALFFSVPLAFSMRDTVNAETVDYNVNIAPSLNVELSSSSVLLNLNPNSKSFGYQDIDVTASTNYEAGYELKMSTADNNTNLKRDATADSVNANINTLAATSPTTTGYTDSDFSNCADSNTNCMNKWGYKNGIANNYFPFVSGTTILQNTTATNADTTTLRFAAKINYDQPAGTYNTELIFTATANPITYDINYYDLLGVSSSTLNDSGITWNNPASGTAKEATYETIATQASTSTAVSNITLNPSYLPGKSAPSRHTYTFAGWCLGTVNNTVIATQNSSNKVTAYKNPGTVCNGTVYQAGDNIQLDPSITNNMNFYALWTPTTFDQVYAAAGKSKAAESGLQYYKMQDITTSICNTVSPMQSTVLVDYRKNIPAADGTSTSGQVNGTVYHVAKLPDGRCWMIDNLALNLNNQNVVNALTTSNTNTTNAAINALKNGGGTDSDGLAQTRLAYSNWTTTDSYTQAAINRAGSCDSSLNSSSQCLSPYQGNAYNYATVINKYGAMPASGSSGAATITYNIGLGDYKVGMLYNYCAASAGSYCYTGSHTDTNNADHDICPANWRLARAGTVTYPNTNYNEVSKLYNDIDAISTAVSVPENPLSFQSLLSTAFVGRYMPTGTMIGQGAYAQIWTSTYRDDPTWMSYLSVIGSNINVNGYAYRRHGFSLRCIAQ